MLTVKHRYMYVVTEALQNTQMLTMGVRIQPLSEYASDLGPPRLQGRMPKKGMEQVNEVVE